MRVNSKYSRLDEAANISTESLRAMGETIQKSIDGLKSMTTEKDSRNSAVKQPTKERVATIFGEVPELEKRLKAALKKKATDDNRATLKELKFIKGRIEGLKSRANAVDATVKKEIKAQAERESKLRSKSPEKFESVKYGNSVLRENISFRERVLKYVK